jgi:dihydrofolate reductase
MGKLIYFTPCSLDGCIGDNEYDWSTPSDETMAFMNDLIRPIGAYLYGRRQYETMAVWQTPEVIPGLSSTAKEFAGIWQAGEKIVYSRTLSGLNAPRTRIEREFDPGAVAALKAKSSRDLTVNGPNLAAQAIKAGLVDEYQLLVTPTLLGRGLRVLPQGVFVQLELLEERRFANGWVWLRYRAKA